MGQYDHIPIKSVLMPITGDPYGPDHTTVDKSGPGLIPRYCFIKVKWHMGSGLSSIQFGPDTLIECDLSNLTHPFNVYADCTTFIECKLPTDMSNWTTNKCKFIYHGMEW